MSVRKALARGLYTMADRARTSGERSVLIDAAHAIERLEQIEQGESFFAVRRLDGEFIHGEYAWLLTSGPDDWSAVEADLEPGCPDGFEMVVMRSERVAVKHPPSATTYDCRACWSADPATSKMLMPPFTCPECDSFNCPKADAHVNACCG